MIVGLVRSRASTVVARDLPGLLVSDHEVGARLGGIENRQGGSVFDRGIRLSCRLPVTKPMEGWGVNMRLRGRVDVHKEPVRTFDLSRDENSSRVFEKTFRGSVIPDSRKPNPCTAEARSL